MPNAYTGAASRAVAVSNGIMAVMGMAVLAAAF